MITFVFVIILLLFLYYKYEHQIKLLKSHYEYAQKVPGPPFLELIGKTGQEIFVWHKSLRERYGSKFRIWFGKDLFTFFSDPDDVKDILSSSTLLAKSVTYNFLQPWLGLGLLTNSGLAWHQRRKLLTPAFHFKVLGCFEKPMEEKCEILINRLKEVADGRPVDVYPYITLFALDVISETAMGTKKNVQERIDSVFVTATQRICHVIFEQLLSISYRIPFIYKFTSSKKERDQLLNILHSETRRTIEERREILQSQDIQTVPDNEDSEFGIKQRLAFLDILLLSQSQGANLSDEDIREEVDTFMFEGHDTTSSALAFCVYFLAKNPDVQAKALQEIKEIGSEKVETLKYLEAVIKEALRLLPSVAFFSRKVTEPLTVGNLTVPVGCFVSIQAHLLHRNENIFPDPEKFNPERFVGDKEYHPYAFVPFSAGPRNCIGQKFAMLELKCTLKKLLIAFEFLPVDGFDIQPYSELITKSMNGVCVRLQRRAL